MNPSDLHADVSKAYTDALNKARAGTGGCCGPKTTCTTVSDLAGYGEQRERFAEAAATSFGCGNPLAFAGVEPGQTVLDLGSGAGFDLLIAAEKVGPTGRIIGIDMTDAMIEEARANVARSGFANVEVRKGLIETLPVEDASVDWVISNCVINLSPDKPRVFAEIARVLRPGGRIAISDIVAEDLPDWLRAHAAAYAACVGGAISETEYVAGLGAAGLADVEVTERIVYDAAQLRGIVEDDLGPLPVGEERVREGLEACAGKVWSARFTGRRA
jgi:SAM-dependent methyltransferase